MSRIAIITRTKNRPVLLRRCLESLLKQTMKEFLWVIVNDNGSKEDVEIIATAAREKKISVLVIHRSVSVGVAAAANHGIQQSASEFIHVLDDDDTIEPDFYESMTGFLDVNNRFMGVVCCGNRVDEEVSREYIYIKSKYPYYSYDGAIYIADILWKNQFTTNSFLYRRAVFDLIDFYDEALPVLEDWEFNLRFLLKFDIGVLPKFLANYHWRSSTSSGDYAQTVTTGSTLHQEYTAIIRNRLLRQDLEKGDMGIGALMLLGRFHQLQSDTLKIVNDRVGAQLLVRRYVKKLLNVVGIKR